MMLDLTLLVRLVTALVAVASALGLATLAVALAPAVRAARREHLAHQASLRVRSGMPVATAH